MPASSSAASDSASSPQPRSTISLDPESCAEIHVERAGLIRFCVKGQVDCLRRTGSAGSGKELVVCGDLLPHDDDLVPVATSPSRNGGIDDGQPHRRKRRGCPKQSRFRRAWSADPMLRLDLQRAIDQIGRLVVKTVGHMEIGLGNRVASDQG